VIVVGFFFLISIIGILAAIAIPQFMSYRVKAYDGMAYTTLQNACSTANEILLKNPNEMVTLEALIQEGLTIPPGVEITIEDGSAQNLTIRSHHQKGRKTYFINIYCNIQELNSTE
jgi:Tfp pilus assembly major pilin PilA